MIDLHLDRRLFVEKFYPYLFDYSHRWEIFMGSAGSSKSYFITQKLILRAINEPIRILVCRRYATTLAQTCFSLFKRILSQWKLYPEYVQVNESLKIIKFPHNGSQIIFTGLDEETKLLSLDDIGTVFIEEAFEVSQDIVEQLNLRMRGKNKDQQIIMAFNPISSHSWLYDFCVTNPPSNYIFIHSTYKDNPYLSQDYINSLEELRIRNPQKARIYCDGEWGIDTDGLVLTNWEIKPINIEEVKHLEHRCGMDYGWVDPSAIIETFYDRDNKTIYVTKEFYKTGQTLDELYDAIVGMELTKSKIVADSAEPRTIDYFKRKNINMTGCIKGQNSVQARITFLQNHKIIVDPSCENLISNLSNFSYEKDNKTNKFIEDKYTHEFSHGIDAMGYAYSDIYSKGRMRTLDKGVLGL